LFEGDDFGVVAVVIEVCAFANDFGCGFSGILTGEDATHLRVWGGEADGLGCEVEGSLHKDFVMGLGRVLRHCFEDSGFHREDAKTVDHAK